VLRSSGFEPALEPPQPSWRSVRGRAPLAILSALLVVSFASQLGLTRGLPADLQGVADLTPTAALVTCCQDQEPDRIVDALLGVSRGLEVIQGPLGTTPGLLQVLDHATEQPPRVTAGFGAHVNAGCHCPGRLGVELPSTSIDADKSASKSKHLHFQSGIFGAPAGHTFLISSHISARGDHRVPWDNQRRSPDAAATARGLDASGVI
jgi:hypothetical protein